MGGLVHFLYLFPHPFRDYAEGMFSLVRWRSEMLPWNDGESSIVGIYFTWERLSMIIVAAFIIGLTIRKVLSYVSRNGDPALRKLHINIFPSGSRSPSAKASPGHQSYIFPPLQHASKKHNHLALSLKRVPPPTWLTIDSSYTQLHSLRQALLRTSLPDVIQVLPSALAASHELLSLIVTHLSTCHAEYFSLTESHIKNHLTSETHPLVPPNPLEIAVRLTSEDLNLLFRNAETGKWHLNASATLFPAGWIMRERIGGTIEELHGPVPAWQDTLAKRVNLYVPLLLKSTLTLLNPAIPLRTIYPFHISSSPTHPPLQSTQPLHSTPQLTSAPGS
jgi:hypothetical protein